MQISPYAQAAPREVTVLPQPVLTYIPGWYLRQDHTIPPHRPDCLCPLCKPETSK